IPGPSVGVATSLPPSSELRPPRLGATTTLAPTRLDSARPAITTATPTAKRFRIPLSSRRPAGRADRRRMDAIVVDPGRRHNPSFGRTEPIFRGTAPLDSTGLPPLQFRN